MKTHNLIIYHCLSCGAVIHCDPEQDAPQCCGRPMIKAAAETVCNGEREAQISAPRRATDAGSGAPFENKPR
ncbi:MAG: hypothetical protein ACT4QC_15340 [Planctomycetaceae bacterium]